MADVVNTHRQKKRQKKRMAKQIKMKREEEQQSVCDGKRGEKMDANRIWQRQWWTTSSLSLSTSVTAVSGLCDLRKLGMVDIASKKEEGKVQAKMLHKSDTLVSCGHHTSPVTHGIAQANMPYNTQQEQNTLQVNVSIIKC